MNPFWYLLLIASLIIIVSLIINTRIKSAKSKSEKTELEKRISELESDVQLLSKYRPIIDVKAEVDRILSEAEIKARGIIADAEEKNLKLINENSELENYIISEKEQIRIERRDTLSTAKQEAEATIRSSLNEAQRVLLEAKEEAKKVAGDAYEALENANIYKDVVGAMKNIIEGYGNKYILPTYSFLDDLAQEFSYTDAGKELLAAKERTKLLIKEDMAAECDYVERVRRTTAIQFVIDAFNGKVDSILTRTKKDNFGTLSQKIEDAYSTVNYLGKAFRNARITLDFLNARKNELKWSCIIVELKEQQKEEQRRIKEQIREEERARREYEKAIKEAEKEELLLRKLIEKAQSQVEKATADEREKFQQQLLELEERLRIAEEKNQRALSMAQQTRAGHVYVISNIGSFGENVYKIGMTRRLEPIDRVRELGDASVPFPFDVHAMIYSEDAPALELSLHKQFVQKQMNKVNSRKEFFKVTISEIKEEVEKITENVSWTMLAEARQYYETLSIEEAIQRDIEAKTKWVQNQERENLKNSNDNLEEEYDDEN